MHVSKLLNRYNDYTCMVSQRITVKMNAWEYDYLYRVQETVILVGCKFNEAPPLNEIIRGLIRYVRALVRGSPQEAYEFRKTVDLFSEMPREAYDQIKGSAQTLPTAEGGNYIFMASETDVAAMEDIMRAVQFNARGSNPTFPFIIRYCIRFVFAKEGFVYNLNQDKYGFVVRSILASVYGLNIGELIEINMNPDFTFQELSPDSKTIVSRFNKELTALEKFVSLNFPQGASRVIKMDGTVPPFIDLPDEYYRARKEHVSVIADFTYLDFLTGLSIASFMWEFDNSSIPWIISQLFISGLKRGEISEKLSKRKKKNEHAHTLQEHMMTFTAFFALSVVLTKTTIMEIMRDVIRKIL